jgi:hypothetical protein
MLGAPGVDVPVVDVLVVASLVFLVGLPLHPKQHAHCSQNSHKERGRLRLHCNHRALTKL